MSPARIAYETRLKDWVALTDADKGTPEGDTICDDLDVLWYAMSEEDLAAIRAEAELAGGPRSDGSQSETAGG